MLPVLDDVHQSIERTDAAYEVLKNRLERDAQQMFHG